MKKKKYGKKLSRSRTARDALMRSMIRALVKHGQIETTLAKAKFAQRNFDKMARLAKKGDLSARRQLLAYLANDKATTDKLFKIMKESKRDGGFLRLIPLPERRGDNSRMAKLVVLDKVDPDKDKKKNKSKDKKEKKNK